MNMKIVLTLIFVIFITISIVLYLNHVNQKKLEIKFPFKKLYDQDNKPLNVVAISAPFRNIEDIQLYDHLKNRGHEFIGISSYSEFPGKLTNPYEDMYSINNNITYEDKVKTWLHCFRNPENYLKTSIPKLLLSESDLKDIETLKPNPNIKKEYDFIYVCLEDNEKCESGWQSYIRSWELAKKCLHIMCSEFNLKGVLVGRKNCEFTDRCDGLVKVLPFLEYNEFIKEVQKAKFGFIPNGIDASPRVLVECLCLDVKVLVNENIVGGWKYINENTGEFFTDENNIRNALNKLLYNQYHPRKWYSENYGLKKSGKILADFLKTHYKIDNPSKMTHVYI